MHKLNICNCNTIYQLPLFIYDVTFTLIEARGEFFCISSLGNFSLQSSRWSLCLIHRRFLEPKAVYFKPSTHSMWTHKFSIESHSSRFTTRVTLLKDKVPLTYYLYQLTCHSHWGMSGYTPLPNPAGLPFPCRCYVHRWRDPETCSWSKPRPRIVCVCWRVPRKMRK